MTAPPPDRPLVTFALLAYNQEKYIRKALEGAFSQTYEPLEIILSDDCSSDRTYEIMQEMAAAYDGPHEVRVRRSEDNRGTLGHILDVAQFANGTFLVVAAGDDISLPERTARLIPCFTDTTVVAGSSDDEIIDESGSSLNTHLGRFDLRDSWYLHDPAWLHGASAVYRTSFLHDLPKSNAKLLYEDQIFSDLIGAMEKRAFRIKDQLIKYRFHDHNISSRHEKSLEATEAAAILRWERAAAAKDYCSNVLAKLSSGMPAKDSNRNQIQRDGEYFRLLSHWRRLSVHDRIKLLSLSIERGQFRTAAIRIFGYTIFILIRRFQTMILGKWA